MRIFYSWQSDLPKNKKLIGEALEEAVKALNLVASANGEIEYADRTDELDGDTTSESVIPNSNQSSNNIELQNATVGVPGTPEIASTIFERIKACDVYIADITFIASANHRKLAVSNPNVLIELGYALGTVTDKRVLLVLDKTYGDFEQLPFDLKSRRHGITFSSTKDREKEKEKLTKKFIEYIKPYLSLPPQKGPHLTLKANGQTELQFQKPLFKPKTDEELLIDLDEKMSGFKPKENTLFRQPVLNLAPSQEQINSYRNEYEEFQKLHEFCRSAREHCIKIEFEIENAGNESAVDVDLVVKMPDFVCWYDDEIILPSPPKKPESYLERNWNIQMPSGADIKFNRPVPAKRIERTDAQTITFFTPAVKQHRKESWEPVFIFFRHFQKVESFNLECSIQAANISEEQKEIIRVNVI